MRLDLRSLIQRLDEFIGRLDRQKNDIIAATGSLNNLVGQFAQQRSLVDKALHTIPDALAVLKEQRDKLADALRDFLRMYRPHEAREDTVVFPAFRSVVSPHEYDALGEDFEKKEDELFGDEGFFKIVDQVAELEKKLGIYDLSQFTPN